VGLFTSGAEHKTREISALIQAFPKRHFVLVGNTGGDDAEAFAELARRYPDRVQRIYLRKAPGADTDERVNSALQGLPAGRWKIFSDPRDLSTDLTRL
jgi:phosphatidate phosphatase APP1